jgi:hypothetical protein
VIGHFGLHEATLVAHLLGSKEAIRYLTATATPASSGWCL